MAVSVATTDAVSAAGASVFLHPQAQTRTSVAEMARMDRINFEAALVIVSPFLNGSS
jgi:riboflavin synthase alpha subunit